MTSETNEQPGRLAPLLLVDDDPLILDSFALALRGEYHVLQAANRDQALACMRAATPPLLVLLDLGLPPRPHAPDEGFGLIAEFLRLNTDVKILILSGQGGSDIVRRALALGAVDFIPKPCDIDLLKARLRHQGMMLEAEREYRQQGAEELLGASRSMVALRELIQRYAQVPHPILIEGESGCGKELVARSIHRQGRRADSPYLKLNCAALPGELLEAQLFGHNRGAFTGAVSEQQGFMQAAAGGSLLFDEIGEMPLPLQSKLLRVLDDGEYYRLGETTPRRMQARIIASTNRDLQAEVRAGRFRLDLYHRLGVLTLHVPPLREREQDRELLFEHFAAMYAKGLQLSEGAQTLLAQYTFPGNVRELRNIIIRLSAKHSHGEVEQAQFAAELESPPRVAAATTGPPEVDDAMQRAMLDESFSLNEVLDTTERRCILAALELAGGNLSHAARMLGLSRTTLYGRMRRLAVTQFSRDQRGPEAE